MVDRSPGDRHRRRIRFWVSELGNSLARIDIEGESALVLREDLDELTESEPSSSVRLLPGYDQWVLGPGTADARIPPTRRTLVTRGANIVIAGGVVSGTWSLTTDGANVSWFSELAPAPGKATGRAGRAPCHPTRPHLAANHSEDRLERRTDAARFEPTPDRSWRKCGDRN